MSTIKQIAQKAGVSPTTVSNVIHGRDAKVSPETLEKVKKILQEENYATNMAAVIMAHNSSRIIGVVSFMSPRTNETTLEDPFLASMLGILEKDIHAAGYYMMVFSTTDPDEVLRLVATWKLDGLIMLWAPQNVCRKIKLSSNIPLVTIDCYFEDDGLTYYNSGTEDKAGAYEMAKYLLSMGHSRILFLTYAPDSSGGDTYRYLGVQEAVAESGMEGATVERMYISKNREERHVQYETLLSTPYTALMFSSDYNAVDAVLYFTGEGISIPGRFSITGFDDNLLSRIVAPRLTTVHQDIREKGCCAVSMLMKLIRGEPVDVQNVLFPVSLVERDSVSRID
ncbi:MAG: LacI family DNA-binding transcriptional regulator [Treponema sp.]|nr:LacI family DNA-binding transcriptional regulator [Candidatus Treponema caballi]